MRRRNKFELCALSTVFTGYGRDADRLVFRRVLGVRMISPYLKRRLRSIEEVLAARKARRFRMGEIGAAAGFSGRFAAPEAARDRGADDAAGPPRDTPPRDMV